MEGSREEEEAEHPLEKGVVEIDFIEHGRGMCIEVDSGEVVKSQEAKGHQDGKEHEGDGRGETNEAMIEVAEDRSQGQEDGQNLKKRHERFL